MSSFFRIDRESFDWDIKTLTSPEIRNRLLSVLNETEIVARNHSLYKQVNVLELVRDMENKMCVTEIFDHHDLNRVVSIIYSVGKQMLEFFSENPVSSPSRIVFAQEYTSKIGFYLQKRYVYENIDYQDGGPIIKKGIHVVCFTKNGRLKESFLFNLDEGERAEEKYLEIRKKLDKYDDLEDSLLS
jgi:hypothetical protein